jgi:hypothetical protein
MDISALSPLLRTPYLPFDDLNEKGLAIGMADAIRTIRNEACNQSKKI